MMTRPDDLKCPVCGTVMDPQPAMVTGSSERQWFICDHDTCPVSSMHVWWRWP